MEFLIILLSISVGVAYYLWLEGRAHARHATTVQRILSDADGSRESYDQL
jgi:hypothetical protein